MDENKATLRQFKKEHPELKGKRVILCDHLRDKSIDCVSINLFIGDKSRVLLCPVCQKYCTQTAWEFIIKSAFFVMDAAKSVEYKQWLETAEKD
jgi:hypothetical protein